jgi:hypothetical protein
LPSNGRVSSGESKFLISILATAASLSEVVARDANNRPSFTSSLEQEVF